MLASILLYNSLMNKKKIIIAVVIVIVAVVIGFVINIIQKPIIPVVSIPDDNIASTTVHVSAVKWIAPEKVKNLDVFKTGTNKEVATFYKVGTFIDGVYKDGSVLVATVVPDGPGRDSIYYFTASDGNIFLIENSSDKLYDGDFLDQNKFSLDSTTVLSDLIFPEKLYFNKSSFTLSGNNLAEPFFNQVYSPADLKLIFSDSSLGNVYTDTQGEQTIKYAMKKNGYYLIAPDGTLRTYSLDMNFYNTKLKIPQVIWSDGTTNSAEYVSTDIGGCGSRNYASVTYDLSLSDLEVIGKTAKGDDIFGLKDQNSLILKDVYDKDYYTFNTPKIPYEEFIQSRPIFFWFDSMGRLIKFKKAEYIPPVECGKPVIYLYPEEKIKVSVKIEPKGGFTFTEPDYGTGWNVFANPDGKLIDLNSGITYPYLFWEGRGGIYTTPERGFIVASSEIHSFLIEKLSKLGLNEKEQADFIEFWEPRMIGAPYFFVTFMGNRVMDEIAPLTITPEPDTVIRILMDYTPLQKPISVQGYEIRTPERKGFTVVEWGGVLR